MVIEVVNPYSCEELVSVYEFMVLEDFETANVQDAGQALGWYVNDDGTNLNRDPVPPPPAVGAPPLPANAPEPNGVPTTEGGAPSFELDCAESPRALRLLGGAPGFKNWGYVFGANINAPELADASEWQGVALWARRGAGTSARTMNATITDRYSLSGTFCVEGLDVTTACDPFGRGVGLDTDWRLYLLAFDEVFQQGYGRPSPLDMPETSALEGFNFGVGNGTFEVWVDDIAYFRSRP